MSWDPWTEAEACGVAVAVVPCPVPGVYFPDRALIAIDAGSPPAVQRSALAHELGHHELRHAAGGDGTSLARQEVRANRWAAARLLPVGDVAAATRGAVSWAEVAAALDVDLSTLETRLAGLDRAERRQVRRAAKEMGL